MSRWIRDERGLSLTELLVAMVVVIIVGGAVATWVSAVTRSDQANERALAIVDQLRFAKSRMVAELRFADEVRPPASGDDEVTLWIDLDGNDFEDADELVTYTIHTDGRLVRTNTAGEPAQQLAEYLLPTKSSLTINDDLVEVNLTADTDTGDNVRERSVATTVKVRNQF